MNGFSEGLVTIALAIVGLGALSILVSRNANTTGVVQSVASGFGNSLGVAEAPVTGSAMSINLGYPAAGNGYSTSFGG